MVCYVTSSPLLVTPDLPGLLLLTEWDWGLLEVPVDPRWRYAGHQTLHVHGLPGDAVLRGAGCHLRLRPDEQHQLPRHLRKAVHLSAALVPAHCLPCGAESQPATDAHSLQRRERGGLGQVRAGQGRSVQVRSAFGAQLPAGTRGERVTSDQCQIPAIQTD